MASKIFAKTKLHVCHTPAIQGHRVEGSEKFMIFHPFQALYRRARCDDYKNVSYVGVGPSKVGQKRAKLLLASHV